MTDREILINSLQKGVNLAKDKVRGEGEAFSWGDVADYLLANGVIVPPVDVGQTVWYVDDFTEEIEECKVYGFNVVNGKLSVLVDNGECKFITRKWHNTKEEAEAELRKRSEQNANK